MENKKFEIRFIVELDFISASGVEVAFSRLFPMWQNLKVVELN